MNEVNAVNAEDRADLVLIQTRLQARGCGSDLTADGDWDQAWSFAYNQWWASNRPLVTYVFMTSSDDLLPEHAIDRILGGDDD